MEFKRYARKPEVIEAAIADGDGNAKSINGFVPYKVGDALIHRVYKDQVNVRGVPKTVDVTYVEVIPKARLDAEYELAPEKTVEPVEEVPTGELVIDPTTKEASDLVQVVAVPEKPKKGKKDK